MFFKKSTVCTLKTKQRHDRKKEFFRKRVSRRDSYNFRIERTSDQATKSTGRMPWHQEPKKDAISCDKLRGTANRYRSVDIRMGQPT